MQIVFFVWLISMFVIGMGFIIKVLIDFRKEDLEEAGRIDEKSLKTLKNQLKRSKAIDQRQANRINTLLEESISILRQKKISQEKIL